MKEIGATGWEVAGNCLGLRGGVKSEKRRGEFKIKPIR